MEDDYEEFEDYGEGVRYQCPECGLEQWMHDINTIVFIAPEDNEAYVYVKCDSGDCEALTYPIDPEQLEHFVYLDSWSTRDGFVEPLEAESRVVETVTVIKELDYGEENRVRRWAEALQVIEPFDITHEL